MPGTGKDNLQISYTERTGGEGMEQKVRKEGFLEKVACALDLPADGMAGLPAVWMTGDREVRVENHRGILAYGTEEIHVGGGVIIIRIRGSGLQLRVMTETELLVTGQIFGVEFL